MAPTKASSRAGRPHKSNVAENKEPANDDTADASTHRRPGRPAKGGPKVTKVKKSTGTGRRGRPPIDPSLKKVITPYVPTGRPRGRPPGTGKKQRKAAGLTKTGAVKKTAGASVAKGGPKKARKSGASEVAAPVEGKEVVDIDGAGEDENAENDSMNDAMAEDAEAEGEAVEGKTATARRSIFSNVGRKLGF